MAGTRSRLPHVTGIPSVANQISSSRLPGIPTVTNQSSSGRTHVPTVTQQSSSRQTHVLDIPSVAVTQILSYLTWLEKLNAVSAIGGWKPHLMAVSAWPCVLYESEAAENIYFVREKRANLLICVKQYGKYMRCIKLAFSHKVGRLGQQILHAISEHATGLKVFHITQEIASRMNDCLIWKRSTVIALCSIIKNCSSLKETAIIQPPIDWSEKIENNIILGIVNDGLAMTITDLELTSNSLLEHEGHLDLLTGFTHLRRLVVRREKINDCILLSLIGCSLKEVTLYQDEEIPFEESRQLRTDFWEKTLKLCPDFKVDMVLEYIMVIKDSFPAKMPLRSLILDDLANIVTKGVIDHLVSNYNQTLEAFTYTNSFLESCETGDKRLPFALVNMACQCSKLEVLRYGFPLSSTTILLIAKARKLKKLMVPSVEVSYEFDWPIQPDWSPEFIDWLKSNGQSEIMLENATSQLLGFPWNLSPETLKLDEQLFYFHLQDL